MTDEQSQPGERIEAYLDGSMRPEERRVFEAALAADAALREQVELQSRADERLRAMFVPGDGAEGLARLPAHPSEPRMGRRGRLAIGLAAVLTLSAGALWMNRSVLFPPDPPRGYQLADDLPAITPEDHYRQILADGFRHDYVCRTEADYVDKTLAQIGIGLVVDGGPGLDVVGWRYGGAGVVIGPGTMTLLARQDGREVVVLMDRAERDPGLETDPASGLNLFRREVDGAVVYEITPLDRPAVLDRVRAPG